MTIKPRRVIFAQYTNPGGYPPIQNAARCFARSGWRVEVVSVKLGGDSDAMSFPRVAGVRVTQMHAPKGRLLRFVHFVYFCGYVLARAIVDRGTYVYASEPLAAPSALAAKLLGRRVIYHEHDVPTPGGRWTWMLGRFRELIWRAADVVIVPNAERLTAFGLPREKPSFVVWNCPSRDEIPPQENERADQPRALRLYYHGNLSSVLLPDVLVDVLTQLEGVCLRAVGYDTERDRTFRARFLDLARRHGVEKRIELLEAVPRSELWDQMRDCDVGLALFPSRSLNPNLRSIVGASNKCFDYMSAGLLLLVPDQPAFGPFVDAGFGIACDPSDAHSVRRAIQALLPSGITPDQRRAAREKILSDWNHERQFEPVLEYLQCSIP
jgi:glycosyltransferase involved in cell wall biosynthesis